MKNQQKLLVLIKNTDVDSRGRSIGDRFFTEYDVQEYIGIFNPIESSVCNETEVDIYEVISSESVDIPLNDEQTVFNRHKNRILSPCLSENE